jgi:hypothetical protein
MPIMSEFQPYLTNDGSIGLYNKEFNDIYHSATGALTEAYEKFILPIDFDILLQNDSIKILDICYGIGYNSKSFLNYILENYFLKNFQKNFKHTGLHIETIYTNNTNKKFDTVNNDTIYSDNIFNKISITAVDNDKILSFLSPFINSDVKNFSNNNLSFKYDNIEKFLSKKNFKSKIKINKIINFLIFEKIAQKYPEIYQNEDIISILSDISYKLIFNSDLKGIFSTYTSKYHITNPIIKFYSFLHNIYYNHISNKYKSGLKRNNLQDINFNLEIGDARQVIKNDNNIYNVIFLDAFTPSKCPCLWSYEFFKLLYEHLDDNGMLLTYSFSPAVRSAMIEAGFHIGNIFIEREKRFSGTFAAKNKELIKYPLSEFDLGLLKTKAGIFYHDKNLTGLNEAIIASHKNEVHNSSRISLSKYKKNTNHI